MVRPGRDLLDGEVEVDETFVGGIEEGGGRRDVGKKALVGVAAEVRGRGTGRIRLGRVLDSAAASILPFVRGAVAPGSLIITDGLPTYLVLPESGYGHRRLVIRGSGENPDALLPRVHRGASLLKRWLLRPPQGAADRRDPASYPDEVTFPFNPRTAPSPGM